MNQLKQPSALSSAQLRYDVLTTSQPFPAFLPSCLSFFIFLSVFLQFFPWHKSNKPLLFHFGHKLFRGRAGPVHGKKRGGSFPSSLSYSTLQLDTDRAETSIFNIWEWGRERPDPEPGVQPQGNLQCSFSRVSFLVTIPRAKGVWLCTAVPVSISGGVLRKECWAFNYQSHINKFTKFNLIFLSQLWQLCENRLGEITKYFAVLYSFRTYMRAFNNLYLFLGEKCTFCQLIFNSLQGTRPV